MENLTIQDQPPPAASSSQTPANNAFPNHQGPPAGGVPQLPPQMFTTAAQLLDLTDKKLLLVLRDGKKLIGVLRSWDQFANLVLQDAMERIFVEDLYADIHRGVFLVRGENVLLLGEIDLDKDDHVPEGYKQGTPEEVQALVKQQAAERKTSDKVRQRKLGALGFEAEHSGEVLF